MSYRKAIAATLLALLCHTIISVPVRAFQAFPSTSILDNFNRANENPLSGGGNWTGPVETGAGKNQLRLVSNAVTGDTSGTSQSYWVATTFNADQEVYAALDTKFTTGSVYFWLNLQSPGTSGVDGYFAGIFNDGSDKTGLYRVTDQSFVATVYEVTTTIADGDMWGVRNSGGTFTTYRKPSGGSWAAVSGASGTDTTYGAGYIGLGCDRNVESWGDFGGGNVSASVPAVRKLLLLGIGDSNFH